MFLRDREYSGIPEFRNEYHGQLRLYGEKRSDREIVAGEIVPVSNDCQMRLDWPINRVIELFPRKDGKTRLVRVAVGKAQVPRPIQRLCPMECSEVPTRSECECDLKVCPAMDTTTTTDILTKSVTYSSSPKGN
ncbi:hypothetical protein ILUMI_06181 [Ignelater luminosus]|uniref:DUF5641 domain-containing protein n=1 Tax=Ignelater luminosus TaxID=2038154 RepID=A0A8K0DAU0_IGNLU|nr:hypothetical protein ILUMI_06181 [Ignelater luminosus]